MKNDQINYIEMQASDLDKTKEFYSKAFGWSFTDFGPEYSSFSAAESGVDGGFAKADQVTQGGPLVVLYHSQLEAAKENVMNAGGEISKDIFSFPGGRRFQFTDPNGNELAVWSDK